MKFYKLMLKARFLRWLHLMWWVFRPWQWRNGVCQALTGWDEHWETKYVGCTCGREWS